MQTIAKADAPDCSAGQPCSTCPDKSKCGKTGCVRQAEFISAQVNSGFTLDVTTRPIKGGGVEDVLHLSFKGELIAFFSGQNLQQQADKYLATYGHLAEWRRQRNIAAVTDKQDIGWSDDMFVTI